MTTITEIIGRVNTQLVDPMMVRWPLAELCDYYNDAVRAVILARPDAGASLETLNCVLVHVRLCLMAQYSFLT